MQLTRAGVRHDTGPWTFVLWTLLSCVRINGCVPALILKHSRSFYYFRGCVCTDFRVYSGVGVVGVQLIKYSLDVMREYGRHGEPCNGSQDCVKHACIGRERLPLASALLLPDRTRETVLLEFPSSRNRFPSTVLVMPKDCFFQDSTQSLNHSLSRHLLVYQCSIRGCSKQILGDLTLRIPTERIISTALTCKLRFYIEKPQRQFDFRSALPYGYPSPEVSCLNFFLAFEALLLHKGKLSVSAPACIIISVSIQLTECADTTKHDAVRRRFKDLDRKSDGRSIYLYIYISWQRRRWPPNWGLAEARPKYKIYIKYIYNDVLNGATSGWLAHSVVKRPAKIE